MLAVTYIIAVTQPDAQKTPKYYYGVPVTYRPSD